jgi:hypothetical protein
MADREWYLQNYVRAKTGLDVEIIEPHPICVDGISLVPIGVLGWVFVFKDSENKLKAIPIPLGLGIKMASGDPLGGLPAKAA